MLNKAQIAETAQYYNQDRPSITSLVQSGRHVILDLGCGAGVVGQKLMASGKAAEVIGVELFAPAAKRAATHYSKVYCEDIEAMELPYASYFDYVICGDILEHLKDPYTVVKRIWSWLKDDGLLVCSVPNVRYWKVIVRLLFLGAWDYSDAGVLDRTHLRFFTRKTCFRMLEDAHFRVRFSRTLISGRRYQFLNRLSLGVFEDLFGSQLVVLAEKVRNP